MLESIENCRDLNSRSDGVQAYLPRSGIPGTRPGLQANSPRRQDDDPVVDLVTADRPGTGGDGVCAPVRAPARQLSRSDEVWDSLGEACNGHEEWLDGGTNKLPIASSRAGPIACYRSIPLTLMFRNESLPY